MKLITIPDSLMDIVECFSTQNMWVRVQCILNFFFRFVFRFASFFVFILDFVHNWIHVFEFGMLLCNKYSTVHNFNKLTCD